MKIDRYKELFHKVILNKDIHAKMSLGGLTMKNANLNFILKYQECLLFLESYIELKFQISQRMIKINSPPFGER